VPAWRDEGLYFLSYRVTNARSIEIVARRGALFRYDDTRWRTLDVSARVGTYARDSSHKLKGEDTFEMDFHLPDYLPIDGSVDALRSAIWSATSREIDSAIERWTRVLTNQKVKVEDKDKSDDFAPEPAVADVRPPASVSLDVDRWSETLRAASARLDASPLVTRSSAEVRALSVDEYFVSSEGVRLRQPRTWYRVAVQATNGRTGRDGAPALPLARFRDARGASGRADTPRVVGRDRESRDCTPRRARRRAVQRTAAVARERPPRCSSTRSSVIASKATGRRTTTRGRRSRNRSARRSFRRASASSTIPRSRRSAGIDLNGHYAYDERGRTGAPATIVDHGVFRGFLMSRSPIEGFAESNGHGRAQPGHVPVARMANTMLTTTGPAQRLRAPRDAAQESPRAKVASTGWSWTRSTAASR
jgi:hypothetical protein